VSTLIFSADEIHRLIETGIGAERDAVTNSVFSVIVARTPVDTGKARGSWEKTINAKPIGANLIKNEVHYIIPLEHGWSPQAPGGMVDVTLAELEAGVLPVPV
jgi:hypothetical protein